MARIEVLRRTRRWSARPIAAEFAADGVKVSPATVSRWLLRLGLNRRRFLDTDGEPLRVPGRIVARYPGHMIHADVKKIRRIPDGGGWRVHGRDSEQKPAVDRAKAAGDGARGGYVDLHSAIDGFSRLGFTEALPNETAADRVLGAGEDVLRRPRDYPGSTRIVIDNGSCYRAAAFTRTLAGARHQRTRPYTPRHNGKWSGTTGSRPRSSCTPGHGPQMTSGPTPFRPG